MVRRWISYLVVLLVSDMIKYRIVKRNKDRWGDYSSHPYYFLQIKIFDWFWIDYYRYPFANVDRYISYGRDLEVLEDFYQELIKPQESYKQTVVKTFYDEDT